MTINMVHMVCIMVLFYFVTVTLLSFYRNIIRIKLANILFVAADLVFFLAWNYSAYLRGWLDEGFMTLGNISPFIMTLIPLTLFMSDKVREYCNSAIAFLWVGMLLALLLSPQFGYLFSGDYHANPVYTSESACHLLASLYGFYLIISGQVKCDFQHLKKAIICLYSVIGFGVFVNYVFHRSNFGMDPYGGAKIYMIDIFGSFEATLAAYLIGVGLVLLIGMYVGRTTYKLVEAIHVGSYHDSAHGSLLNVPEPTEDGKDDTPTEKINEGDTV